MKKQLTIIPYVFIDEQKQEAALILCKHAEYEGRALKHMINNLINISNHDIKFRRIIRIVAQTAFVTALLSEYNKFHKYLFPVNQYLWAENIDNGMYKIKTTGQLLLNAPL